MMIERRVGSGYVVFRKTFLEKNVGRACAGMKSEIK